MFERYTERARRTIYYARWWALQRETTSIGTCDIILGVASERFADDSPLEWLHDQEILFFTLYAQGIACVRHPPERKLPLSNSSKCALAYAAEEAALDKRYSIDVHHLFRGVLRTGNQVAQQLSEAGYSIGSMREDSRMASAAIPDAKWRLKDLLIGPWLPVPSTRQYVVLGCILLVFLAVILYLQSQN